MRAAFIEKPGTIRLEEVPVPECRDHEVLINVKEVGICGSDLHYFEHGRIGDHVIREPHILGHECSGFVVEVGREVRHLRTGDRVAVEPGVPCFACSACRTGHYNLCDSVRFLGAPPCHGAFREYLAHDGRFVYALPDGVSFSQGAMVEPLAVAYHAVRTAGVLPGQTVLIVGCGPIGFSCLEVLQVAGAAAVIVSEPQEHRRRTAEAMGASLVIDPQREDVREAVREATSGRLCDCALEASGTAAGVLQGIESVRRGGSVALIGMGESTMSMPHAQILKKQASLHGVYRYANAYPPVLSLLEAGRLQGSAWISHRLGLERIQEAMEMSGNGTVDKLKMIITTERKPA